MCAQMRVVQQLGLALLTRYVWLNKTKCIWKFIIWGWCNLVLFKKSQTFLTIAIYFCSQIWVAGIYKKFLIVCYLQKGNWKLYHYWTNPFHGSVRTKHFLLFIQCLCQNFQVLLCKTSKFSDIKLSIIFGMAHLNLMIITKQTKYISLNLN
jgi:hypothetical protein